MNFQQSRQGASRVAASAASATTTAASVSSSSARQPIRRGLGLAAILLAVLALAAPFAALAQLSGKGGIAGTVTDPSGAVIPNATVTATEDTTSVKTVRQTTSAGDYNMPTLDPGVYTVTVVASGFSQVIQRNVRVDALQTVGLNLKLAIGQADQTVTVNAAPPQLDTTDATLGATMENEMYSALPLAMGANGSPDQRRATDFAYLMPGVQNNETNGNATDNTGPINGSGSRGATAEIYIDGVAFTAAAGTGDPRYVWTAISVDAVEQFQVQTSGYSAQYQGQGLENFVVKSGGNQFHGSLYEYFRNTALDAFGYFAKTPNIFGKVVKPVEHQNEYGIVFSGPIIKDKLFFFGNYGGYRYLAGPNYKYQTNPTAQMLAGDFTGFSTATKQNIYDPSTQTCNANGSSCSRVQFDGMKNGVATKNVIPVNQISNASKIFQSYLPPLTNSNLTNNWLGGYSSGLSNWMTTNRVDYTVNQKQQLSLVVGAGRQASLGIAGGAANQGPVPYITSQEYAPKTNVYILEHTYTINSRMVNQLKYGYGRYAGPGIDPSFSPAYAASAAGIGGLPAGGAAGAFPGITFSGTDATLRWAGYTSNKQATNTYDLVDNFQYVRGKHSLTAGIQIQWLQYNYTSILSGTSPLKASFSDAQTGQFKSGTSTIDPKTGASYASFLLGAVGSGNFVQNSVIETGARFRPISPYIQDDYKPTKNLTLNLGLRWDIYPSYREARDRFSFMNPKLVNPVTGNLGALEFAGHGTDSCNCSTPVSTYLGNFGPRLGAAYAVNDKTVIRASYGVMYTHGGAVGGSAVSRQGTGLLGLSANPNPTSTLSLPVFYWDKGFPAYQPPPFISAGYGTAYSTTGPLSPSGMSYGDTHYGSRAPQYINWTFGVQRQITSNMAITVSYVGSQGHFEISDSGKARGFYTSTLNPSYLPLGNLLSANATPANIAAADAIIPGIALPYASFPTKQSIGQMLRPFPQFTGVSDVYGNVSNSAFNALQLSLVQRESHGLTFMLNYSYSKAIDDGGTFRNSYNDRLDRALSTTDEPQNLTLTSVYKLPFGRGGLGGDHLLVRALAGGWQVSGIFTYHSGNPLPITATGCVNPASNQCMPNLNPAFVGHARINGSWGAGANAKSISSMPYIDKNAFAIPTEFTFGNSARTAPLNLWAPSAYNIDAGLRRTFPIHESLNFTLQADVLNVTNDVVFGGIGTTYSPTSQNGFGEVTKQVNLPRDIQLAARINF